MLGLVRSTVFARRGASPLARRIALLLLALALPCVAAPGAHALPSFARQTGLHCNACHTWFPELNSFGRSFKLNGYTFGGGNSKLPAIAAMLQPDFTHTAKGQPGGAAPGFGDNDNFALDQASLFYGGKILDHLGAFVQTTYSGPDNALSLDNTDIRYADRRAILGTDTVFGVTLNNNPTVQDPWNTTPAWGYPFAGSGLAPAPGAATALESFGGKVAGLSGYALADGLIYGEIGGYAMLSNGLQSSLGTFEAGADEIAGIAPYWRLAVQRDMGVDYVSAGTFGMSAAILPGGDGSRGEDRLTDVGFDVQYQHVTDLHTVSVLASYIYEHQDRSASFALGGASNSSDDLHSLKASVSYLYDASYGVTAGYFSIGGSADAALYAGNRVTRPDSDGFVFELAYFPFNRGGPSFWPWLNAKLMLQYTLYNSFDGAGRNYDSTGRDASDNDTLLLMAWLAF